MSHIKQKTRLKLQFYIHSHLHESLHTSETQMIYVYSKCVFYILNSKYCVFTA